eukprot:symbB.v1.2.043400.t1/scaffold14357.1/size860/1
MDTSAATFSKSGGLRRGSTLEAALDCMSTQPVPPVAVLGASAAEVRKAGAKVVSLQDVKPSTSGSSSKTGGKRPLTDELPVASPEDQKRYKEFWGKFKPSPHTTFFRTIPGLPGPMPIQALEMDERETKPPEAAPSMPQAPPATAPPPQATAPAPIPTPPAIEAAVEEMNVKSPTLEAPLASSPPLQATAPAPMQAPQATAPPPQASTPAPTPAPTPQATAPPPPPPPPQSIPVPAIPATHAVEEMAVKSQEAGSAT